MLLCPWVNCLIFAGYVKYGNGKALLKMKEIQWQTGWLNIWEDLCVSLDILVRPREQLVLYVLCISPSAWVWGSEHPKSDLMIVLCWVPTGDGEQSDPSSKRPTNGLWLPGHEMAFPDTSPYLIATQVGRWSNFFTMLIAYSKSES